jgi:hypothetical protein
MLSKTPKHAVDQGNTARSKIVLKAIASRIGIDHEQQLKKM